MVSSSYLNRRLCVANEWGVTDRQPATGDAVALRCYVERNRGCESNRD
ncbi:hypothetical protein HSB1_24620 [Halogranum salarium B-1]|uniref:Uncharacterized protein n=1 Tax=Halogranum salarium B-1 TaxID=1210908 RepID=J3JFA0_9EURY|nr:hypothetical protein HSB1_24620 [Halogranum salarium B-1]